MASDFSASELRPFLETSDIPELGPGPRPGVATLAHLSGSLDKALSAAPLPPSRRDLIRSLVFLWHDHLDASHRISQGIDSVEGSYVHGIMHRREPDYGNAKYWFHRVGNHACFASLAAEAIRLAGACKQERLADRLVRDGQWDAFAFIDLCEEAADQPPESPRVLWLRKIQRVEFQALFDYFVD